MAYSDADRLLTVRGTLTYPDTGTQALTSAHISSFLVNEDAGRDVPVGAAPAASFELKLDNSSGQWEPGGSILGAHVLDGAKVEIEIGLWNGAAYDYSDIGTYYVDDVQGQEHETLIRLKGSDAMVSLMSEYYADGAGDYPQTLSSLLTDIAAVAGVTLESAVFTNSAVSIPAQPAWKNNLTCREAVGYIAACAGGIARFNRAGKLEIAPLEKVSSRAVSTSVYKTIQKGDTSFGGLNAINVYAYGAPDGTSPSRYATTPATPDTSLNSINIKGNPILAHGSTALAALGAGMLSALTGLAFRGATFEWHGDPAVELGDLCTVTDLSSTAIPILITKQTLRFASGFSMNSGCAVTTSTKADASGKLQKIFTPTGNLNAEALAGNIYVKAGEIMTLESGGIMNVLSGGEMNVAAGGKINLTTSDDLMIGAQSIKAFAETIDLSANNSIKLTVSSLGEGGTNLIPNSDFSNGWTGWTNWSGATLTTSPYSLDGVKESGYVICPAGDTIAGAYIEIPYSATGNQDMTLSLFAYLHPTPVGLHGAENDCGAIQQYDEDGTMLPNTRVTYYFPDFDGTSWWQRITKTVNVLSTCKTIRVYFWLRSDGTSQNSIRVTNFQLERGTVATAWKPSPSDPVSGVKTSYIDIATDHIDISSGGIMNVLSGGEMNIASGGKLKLASGNDVDIGADTLADLLAAATSQTTIWYQDNQPTATATGDIWYDTDASPVTIKRWNGSSWVDITTTALSQALTAAGTAQATADGKIKAWAQTTAPSATAVGDLWIDTDDNNKLYRATAAGTGNWVLYKVAAGYVSTSHITIDNDSIDIVSGGTLTLNAADDIKIGSGGGTLASTIDLSANNSIKLAVSGGTNLLTGTSAELRNVSVSRYYGTVQADLVYADLGLATNDSITFRVYLKAINKPLKARISQYRADATYDSVTGNLIPLGSEGFSTVTTKVGADKVKCSCLIQNGDTATYTTTTTEEYKWAKFERGTMATDWSPAPSDPASGVKTSYIDIATDHIDISSGGNLSITSPKTLKITSGTTDATALAVRNDTDYFISAGHLTQSSAPFWVKKDGSIKATSGTIGGFTIGSSSLSAQATGKPLLKLDAANSEIILGGLKLFYSGSSGYEFNVGTDELRITASYFGVVGANVFFDVMDGYAWCNGNMSAKSFTDRTPAYTGKNAVAELKLVRNDKNGNIDHSTLPAFARKKITLKDKKSKESEADGRDLGAMISILTKAVQELDERLEKIEDRIK